MHPLRAALLLALCLPALPQTWGTFYAAYDDGLKAQARGDWDKAVRAFAGAAALEPRPGRRLRTYGLNFLPTYHPYLHLAECALDRGDVALAEKALADSDHYGTEPEEARRALRARMRAGK